MMHTFNKAAREGMRNLRANRNESERNAVNAANREWMEEWRSVPDNRAIERELNRERMQQWRDVPENAEQERQNRAQREAERLAEIQHLRDTSPIGCQSNWDYFTSNNIDTFYVDAEGEFINTKSDARVCGLVRYLVRALVRRQKFID